MLLVTVNLGRGVGAVTLATDNHVRIFFEMNPKWPFFYPKYPSTLDERDLTLAASYCLLFKINVTEIGVQVPLVRPDCLQIGRET